MNVHDKLRLAAHSGAAAELTAEESRLVLACVDVVLDADAHARRTGLVQPDWPTRVQIVAHRLRAMKEKQDR